MTISPELYEFVSLDVPPLLTATACALACSVLGTFLLLRRASLMGDAISHAVLPGIVGAFLISGSRSGLTVFIGAASAGIVAAILIEIVREFGKVEPGASMGVVFAILFALGVILMEQAAARNVDLDADCLLHGQLETLFWSPPRSVAQLFSMQSLAELPSEVWMSVFVLGLVVFVVWLLFKELALSSFDPELAVSLGFSARGLHYLLMVLVAGAVVASFKAVGSILVIAMLICPAASARMLTDRLRIQLFLSAFFAVLVVTIGYFSAAFLPQYLGYEHSLNAAGMMASVSGGLLFGAVMLAPQYGVIGRWARSLVTKLRVSREDFLGLLYRAQEQKIVLRAEDMQRILGTRILQRVAWWMVNRDGYVSPSSGAPTLTESGMIAAKNLVRTHRLWESYLVDELGLRPDHVHERAEQLEHYTGEDLQRSLGGQIDAGSPDPHGREIPDQGERKER